MQVLSHLLYLMRVSEKAVQRRVALALAHLCSVDDQRTIFIDNNGIRHTLSIFMHVGSFSIKLIFCSNCFIVLIICYCRFGISYWASWLY